MATSLGHYPRADRWEFDETVTAVFDDMLARSIPDLAGMRRIVTEVAGRFVVPRTDIVDLGASKGDAVAPLISRFGALNRFHLVECSDPMADALEARFSGYITGGVAQVHRRDLREFYPPAEASVTLAVLTLMFVPINYRHRILDAIYEHTRPGGCLLLVEKILGADAHTDELIQGWYRDFKLGNGYSHDEVERKRLALEGVQVPVTAAWNEDALRAAGFASVERIWQHMNFAGWVAIK